MKRTARCSTILLLTLSAATHGLPSDGGVMRLKKTG